MKGVEGMLPLHELAKMLNQTTNDTIRALSKIGITRRLEAGTILQDDELRLIQERQMELEQMIDAGQTISEKTADRLDKFIISTVQQHDLLFIDTSSLLQTQSALFMKRLFPILKKENKRLLVPLRVYEEMKSKQNQTYDKELSKLATQIEKELAKFQSANLLDLVGDDNLDEFADNVFNTQITRLRMRHSIVLITNDISLGTDILALNDSQSVRGKRVSAVKVSYTGHLMRILSREEFKQKNTSSSPVHSQPASNRDKIPESEKFSKNVPFEQHQSVTLPFSNELKKGAIVHAMNGHSFTLGEELGSGGEGAVYATNSPGMVAKIYKPSSLTTGKYNKLKLMVEKRLKHPGICYPSELLFNSNKQFVGYLMPEAKGRELKNYLFIPKKVFEKRHPEMTRQDLVELIMTILEKIKYLHDRNIVLGDINPFNILVVSPKEVYFVDVDSYQVEGYPCPVGTDSFTAPEIQGKNFKTFLRTESHDRFAIATLIFSILFLGKSPYSQTGGESSAKNIQAMDFPYHLKGERAVNEPRGQWRFIWSNLPYYMKEPLYKTFQKGEKYAQPDTRLDVNHWLDVMTRYRNDLRSGLLIRQDEIANDIFPNRFKNLGDKNKLEVCKVCDKEYMHWQVKEGVCENCMYRGEEYRCQGCDKELIFTNFEKHIKKLKEPRKYCEGCHKDRGKPWDTPHCIECGNIFTITKGNKEFYDERKLNYPKRCPSCRSRSKQSEKESPSGRQSTVHRQVDEPFKIWSVLSKMIFGGKK